MSKKAFIFLAEGFEEIEVITPIDVFRRAEIDTVTVSISSDKMVLGAHNVAIQADMLLADVDVSDADLLVLPGGMPGAKNLGECEKLCKLLKNHADAGKLTAAICAAPSVLGALDILVGKEATCYPGWEDKLKGALYMKQQCVVDGNIVTGQGPGAAMEFALTLVAILKSQDLADELAGQMIVNQ